MVARACKKSPARRLGELFLHEAKGHDWDHSVWRGDRTIKKTAGKTAAVD